MFEWRVGKSGLFLLPNPQFSLSIAARTVLTMNKVVYLGFNKALGIRKNERLVLYALLVFSCYKRPYPHSHCLNSKNICCRKHRALCRVYTVKRLCVKDVLGEQNYSIEKI